MQGLHLTADLYDCQCDAHWLTDGAMLLDACCEAAVAAGLQVVGTLSHQFAATEYGPGGATCAVLVAESHLCVHTWPERRAVTLDVYVCNFRSDHDADAEKAMASLVKIFEPKSLWRNDLRRGADSGRIF